MRDRCANVRDRPAIDEVRRQAASACRFVVTGKHTGPFQGMPPTGKEFTLPGITILRFSGERCVERWSQADFLGLLQQLGALPALGD